MIREPIAVLPARPPRVEWRSDDVIGKRYELYARAAPLFRKYGYAGTTLKALARACGLSIPALYTYFPSKRAFALFPLHALYPELHGPPSVPVEGDPRASLTVWVESAANEQASSVLALRMALETGLTPEESDRIAVNLGSHANVLAGIARRAAVQLDERSAHELAWAMIMLVTARALPGGDLDPAPLRNQLLALLRGYGVSLG